MERAEQHLRRAGLKVTKPRLRVLGALARSEQTHLSVKQLHSILSQDDLTQDISFGTLYRVLNQFVDAEIVEVKQLLPDSSLTVYELASPDHHDHLVCVDCGRVVEFCDQRIEEAQVEIAKANGFELIDHRHNLYASCIDDECEHKKEATSDSRLH